MANMAFVKGQPKTGGRKPGGQNLITRQLKDLILGALDKVGGQAYLERQAEANPVAFLTLLGKIIPTQVEGSDGGPMQVRIVWGSRPTNPS
jgi:hypothetical protein